MRYARHNLSNILLKWSVYSLLHKFEKKKFKKFKNCKIKIENNAMCHKYNENETLGYVTKYLTENIITWVKLVLIVIVNNDPRNILLGIINSFLLISRFSKNRRQSVKNILFA